jgi:hypothetical protein
MPVTAKRVLWSSAADASLFYFESEHFFFFCRRSQEDEGKGACPLGG